MSNYIRRVRERTRPRADRGKQQLKDKFTRMFDSRRKS